MTPRVDPAPPVRANSIPFGDLARESAEVGSLVEEAIRRVVLAGRFILGPEVIAFEDEFRDFSGAAGAVATASGTDALLLALVALGLGEGAEVITSTLTSVATATAIVHAGCRPVLVDVDPVTLNLDPNQVEKRMTRRTKVILPVHLYGCPVEMAPIIELAASRDLHIVEDCAHAHGARIGVSHVGTTSDAGCFSFYPTKNLGAYGDGGMVTFKDPKLGDRLVLLRQYGWRERDLSEIIGFNSRLDELQAAVLRVKLRRLEAWNMRRRQIAERYVKALSDVEAVGLPKQHDGHVYHLFVVRTANREQVREKMLAQGISTGIHYRIPIHRQPAFQFLLDRDWRFPVADKACAEIVSLPMFPQLTDEEADRVADCLRQAIA